jgi:collagenase-like PrtC family protease
MKIFCLPYNGDNNLVKDTINSFGDSIYEFYGSDSLFKSSTKTYSETKDLSVIVRYLLDNNIQFCYILNSLDIRYYEIMKNDIINHLKKLKDFGITMVTVSQPYVSSIVKEAGLQVNCSTLQNIHTETGIKHMLNYGYSRITINENYTKDISNLRYLREVTPKNIPFEIIASNGCFQDCPNKLTHYTPTEELSKFCYNFCSYDTTSIDWLRRVCIRYQDIEKYQDIGIELFKIPGRFRDTEDLKRQFAYWLDNKTYKTAGINYLYNFLKITPDIPLTELDNYFEFLFTKPGCTHRCTECGFCKEFSNKLMQKYNPVIRI